mmetsp:Transcript_32001/g.91848  ORF Transcript_32001/g.91848 Transcript_32001/m.91848 type:complete len:266 (-) Transcript_32001:815-1612(-)
MRQGGRVQALNGHALHPRRRTSCITALSKGPDDKPIRVSIRNETLLHHETEAGRDAGRIRPVVERLQHLVAGQRVRHDARTRHALEPLQRAPRVPRLGKGPDDRREAALVRLHVRRDHPLDPLHGARGIAGLCGAEDCRLVGALRGQRAGGAHSVDPQRTPLAVASPRERAHDLGIGLLAGSQPGVADVVEPAYGGLGVFGVGVALYDDVVGVDTGVDPKGLHPSDPIHCDAEVPFANKSPEDVVMHRDRRRRRLRICGHGFDPF